MDKSDRIFVAGHRGLVGSAIVRNLKNNGYNNIIIKTRDELDLTNQSSVMDFFQKNKIDFVFLAAAKVGGIMANSTRKAEFIYENLMIQTNIIHSAYLSGVKKLLFLGSSCIYPKLADQPIKEDYLLSGYLEPTNDAYAIAKIAGLIQCKSYNEQYKTNYISAMPTNLYGINDNFDPVNSHVLPALIRRFHEARINSDNKVVIWGTGKPMREFLFVDDLADALIFLMKNYKSDETINVGTGVDVTISELAHIVAETTGFKGNIEFDTTKPDGTPRKLLDVSKINNLGWRAVTDLRAGIAFTYKWFVEHYNKQ